MATAKDLELKNELEDFFKKNPELASIDVLVPTISGHLRGKRVPIHEASKVIKGGMQMPTSTTLLDMAGANCRHLYEGTDDGDPDIRLKPIKGTICRVPWAEEPRAQVLAYQYTRHGGSFYGDPRRLLQKEVRRYRAALGLKPVMALEFEFYLCKPDLDKGGLPDIAALPDTNIDPNDVQCYGMDDLDAFDSVLTEINEALQEQGMEPCSTSKEYSPGQYEVNLTHYDDPLMLCDQAMMYRRAIKAIARKHNLEATFMAKPFEEWAGSGLHAHVSLLNEEGKNIFAEGLDDLGEPIVNDYLKQAIGGCLKYTKDFMMLYAPTANSYRRFSMASDYAPVNSAWGVNDRSVAFRVPLSDTANSRFEHRISGADANPYLVCTAILASMRAGLMEQLDPGHRAQRGRGHEQTPKFPLRWFEAILAFKKIQIGKGCFWRYYAQSAL